MNNILKNGLYMTSGDFPQWQDYITNLFNSHDLVYTDNILKNHSDDACDSTADRSKLACKNITFVVTESCNLACTYCYECHKTNRRMSKEIAKQAVDFIFDEELVNGYYTKEDSPSVILDFIGGEPLLEIDIIDYIVEYFKQKAFELDILLFVL